MNIPALTIALSLGLAVPVALAAQEAQPQTPPQQAQMSANTHSIIGKKAANEEGKNLGKIKDVLVSPDGKVQAMVVDVKGKDRAVPWDQISMQADQVTVRMNDQQLSQLPEYKSERD